MRRRHTPPAAPPAPVDRSWDARATALRREGPANTAMLAAVVSVLAALVAWIAVLGPASGSVRGSPVFWLLAVPILAWTGPLLNFREWAVRSVPLFLAAAPLAALGAMEAARMQRASDILSDDRLDTPTAMLVILGVSIVSTLAGLVALRRSSLPGGTRPVTFAAPGSLPPGLYPLPDGVRQSLRVGSLALSGALVNGVFFAIVTLLEAATGDFGPNWPVILPVAIAIATLVLMIRGIRGLVRRREGAENSLRRSWLVGAGGAALELLLVWAWPTDIILKLAFSAFMLPMALAAVWGARRALRGLHEAGGMKAA